MKKNKQLYESVNRKKKIVIAGIYYSSAGDRIVPGEGEREFYFFVGIPFEFKCTDFAIRLLQVINLLLLGGSPEIFVTMKIEESVEFVPFRYQVVFPKCSHIIPVCQKSQVPDQGIADPVIIEIDLFVLFYLVSQVPGESGQFENNK